MQDRIRTIEKDLDLNNNFLVNCNCKQYDTIKFIFNMFMDGEVADLSDCIFRLQAKKGDGLPYINNNSDNISVIGNIVTIDNDNQLTARAGDTFAEVVITDKNGHMKTTFDIRLNIKSSAIDGLVDSEATITILDSLEEKLNKVDNIGTVLEEANTTEKSLNNLIPTGNILKDNLDSIIGTGSTLKNDLDTVVQSSSTLKDNLDIANILAESNIEELNKLGDVTDLAIQVQTNTNNISDLEADKTDILNAIGTTNMGTTATTLKGAIAEHEEQINNNTTQLSDMTKKVISFVSVLEYGADRSGVNDSTQAFKDAIDYAKTTIVSSSFSNGVVVVIPSGIYKITDQIIIPPFVRIKTQGFVCISSSVANKSTLWITHQSGETTFYNMMLKQQYERSPIINASDGGMLIKSTLDKASGCIGLEIGSTSTLKDADNKNLSTSRYSLCDIAIENFDIGMQMNIYNHYIGTFDNLHLETNNTLVRFGKDGDTTVNNSGENFSFHGGVFASSTIGFDWYCDGFQCNFYGCSFDFITTLFNFRRGYKKVGIWGGHIEGITTIGDATNSSDTASLPQLYINNPQCFCDSLTLFKGLLKLICDNVKWTRSSSTQTSMYICDYNTIAKEICHISQGHDIALSPMLNKINNSKFQNIDISAGDVSAPFTGYTITSGGFNTSVVTSTIPTSSSYTRALKVVSISDTSWFQLATPNYSANPGDIIQIGIMYYTDATSINVKSKAIFYDVLGNTISSTGFYSDNANADLTKWNSSFNVPIVAPAGTEKVSIVYSISGVATGKTFYIGEMFLGIS